MDGCEGCSIGPRGQNEQLQSVRKAAKDYATANSKTVAIYKEAFDYKYCDYDFAISQGYPIAEMVSQHH